MKRKITRRQIIQALRTEPLKAGTFVARPTLNRIGHCEVCAVGAVLRQQAFTNVEIFEAGKTLVEAGPVCSLVGLTEARRTGQWLNVLSCVFEHYAVNCTLNRARAKTIRYVQKRFPEVVVVDLPSHYEHELAQFDGTFGSVSMAHVPSRGQRRAMLREASVWDPWPNREKVYRRVTGHQDSPEEQ